MAFLEVDNIHKSFGKTEVLKGISFSLEEGEVMSIIGSSGNGKTTLLRCLNFLELADGGKITVDGNVVYDSASEKKIKECEIRDARLNFGLVFQSFNLFPQYTVFENIRLPLMLLEKERAKEEKRRKKDRKKSEKKSAQDKKWYEKIKALFVGPKKTEEEKALEKKLRKEEKERAKAEKKRRGERAKEINDEVNRLLEKVGLSDKANNYPCELSGGQCQRVAIARAIALKPKILCFDEPTSALDPELTGEVLKVIKELKETSGITMIIVTHEMEFAANVSDKILFMADGRAEQTGAPDEIFGGEQCPKLYAFLHPEDIYADKNADKQSL